MKFFKYTCICIREKIDIIKSFLKRKYYNSIASINNGKISTNALLTIHDWRAREKECNFLFVFDNDNFIKEMKKLFHQKNWYLKALKRVNRYVNCSIKYQTDENNWSRIDYWESSCETLIRKKADCEGQAILKYRILKEIGFEDEDMFIAVMRDHATLIVRVDDNYYILDNSDITYAVQKTNNVIDPNELLFGFNLSNEYSFKNAT